MAFYLDRDNNLILSPMNLFGYIKSILQKILKIRDFEGSPNMLGVQRVILRFSSLFRCSNSITKTVSSKASVIVGL